MTHVCVSKLIIIGLNNGLSPGRRQAILWTNAGILLIGPLGTNFSEILIEIHVFSFKKMHLKMSSGKRRPFCLSLNVLTNKLLINRDAMILMWCHHNEWMSQWGQPGWGQMIYITSYNHGNMNPPITQKQTGCQPPYLSGFFFFF